MPRLRCRAADYVAAGEYRFQAHAHPCARKGGPGALHDPPATHARFPARVPASTPTQKQPLSPQSLRHGFATHFAGTGTDIDVIQELLGHASVPTTIIYTHVTLEHLGPHPQPTGLTRRCPSERFGLKPRLDQPANNRRHCEVADVLRAASSITAGPRLRPRSKWSSAASSAPAVINASPTIRAATATVPCNKTSHATIGSTNGWPRSCRFPRHGGEVAPVDSLIWKTRARLAEPAS
jgi:hypothetical protein